MYDATRQCTFVRYNESTADTKITSVVRYADSTMRVVQGQILVTCTADRYTSAYAAHCRPTNCMASVILQRYSTYHKFGSQQDVLRTVAIRVPNGSGCVQIRGDGKKWVPRNSSRK